MNTENGKLDPVRPSDLGCEMKPLSLWHLAHDLSPRRWRAFNRAFHIRAVNLGKGTRARASNAVQRDRRYCRLDDYKVMEKELEYLNRRAKHFNRWARFVLLPWIEERVMGALQSGNYIITGIGPSGVREEISPLHLPTLSIDFSEGRNDLYSPTYRFSDVSVYYSSTLKSKFGLENKGRKPGGSAKEIIWAEAERLLLTADQNLFHSTPRRSGVNVSALAKRVNMTEAGKRYSIKHLSVIIGPSCREWKISPMSYDKK